MWKPACVLMVVLVTAVAGFPAQEAAIEAHGRSQIDQEHTKWIDHVMRTISTIKPGMTRKDLLGMLTGEGGISTRTQRRYVYKHCPYIKLDVEFSPTEQPDDAGQAEYYESLDDKIVKISRPYLEYSIMD
jgi:hypothetical protein